MGASPSAPAVAAPRSASRRKQGATPWGGQRRVGRVSNNGMSTKDTGQVQR